MSDRLEVGEVAIYVGDGFGPERIGSECTVVGGLETRLVLEAVRGNTPGAVHDGVYEFSQQPVYVIEFPDKRSVNGYKLCASPNELRKRKPPQDDLDELHPNRASSWDRCPWRPLRELVDV